MAVERGEFSVFDFAINEIQGKVLVAFDSFKDIVKEAFPDSIYAIGLSALGVIPLYDGYFYLADCELCSVVFCVFAKQVLECVFINVHVKSPFQ